MNKPSYHHGNLKTDMIQVGIKLVHESGFDKLSLRKIATACNVSPTAPYSHFKNKAELLEAMTEHVIQQFASILTEAIDENNPSFEGLHRMGIAYVLFFLDNPLYFDFLFQRLKLNIDFKSDTSTYKPFMIYKEFITKILEQVQYPKELQLNAIISHWALVQGLTSIVVLNTSITPDEWRIKVLELLSGNYFLNYEKL